jgi:hypothetical protein
MRRVVESYGLRLDVLPLEAVTSLPGVVPEGAVTEEKEGKKEEEEGDSGLQLRRLFDRTTTLTSREDLLAYLRTHLLASVAAQREYVAHAHAAHAHDTRHTENTHAPHTAHIERT